MFEQDYIIRQIKQFVAAAVKLVFKIDTELPESMMIQDEEKKVISDELLLKIDSGNIRDAVSQLYTMTEDKNKDDLLIGLMFYSHLCEKDDDFLNLNNISLSEIKEGMKYYFSQFGIPEVTDLFFNE